MSLPTSVPPVPAQREVAVVRQPISDARRNVVGYELVVGGEGAGAVDAESTSSLLLEAFGDIGIEQLSGSHPAWLGVSQAFLLEVGTPPVRPDKAVLQLTAREAGDDVLAVLQQLTRSGYTLAVDGFEGGPHLAPLLQLASIVKVDVSLPAVDLLALRVAAAGRSGARLTAVGVESDRDFERCRDMGFAYFQGPFFAKPREVRQRGVATSGVGSLRSLKELGGDVSFEDLERIIASDVGLSLKLLRYVNSAFFALPRTIGSVREALQMLGMRTVQRWATVMAMSSMPDVPSELIGIALLRARMCETLGEGDTPAEREGQFTVGLFSVADALLGRPMEDVLEELPFDEEIQAALLRREGAKGELLEAIIAYERGEFPELPPALAAEGKTLAGAYRDALEWAESARRVSE